MKTEQNDDIQRAKLTGASAESSQLLSLLALAAGAVLMPQTSEADVIYTNLVSPETVGPSDSLTFIIDNLPGTAQIGFHGNSRTKSSSLTVYRWVSVVQQAGFVGLKTQGFFAIPANAGKVWGTLGGSSSSKAFAARWTESFYGRFHNPDGFTDMYYAFRFADSTQGNAIRYGWIKVSLNNSSGNTGGPDLTISSWAYDTTGTQLPMGSLGVPEPSSVALLALGALTLGAKGIRNWRRNRPATSQP